MSTIQELFQQAQLAEAAYANFAAFPNSVSEALKAEGFSDSQATRFVSQWRLVNHIPDTARGFSATLFERLDNGNGTSEFRLAIRGSTFDAGAIDFRADAADIFLDGAALDQLVDMNNYWQRLCTPTTSTYAAAKLVTLQAETAELNRLYALPGGSVAGLAYEIVLRARPDILIDYPSRTVRTIQFVDSSALSDSTLRQGVGFQGGISSISASGHSLGGHLAMAFTRLFPGLDASALGINGLGFLPTNTNVDYLFALLGGAPGFDAGRILNVYGTAGPEFAAQDNYLRQVGGYQGIYIESAAIASQALGHSAVQMTDSLAIYDLFARMDQVLNTADPAVSIDKITGILKASSAQAPKTLEAALDMVRKLFTDPFTSTFAPTTINNREQYYQNLSDLQGRIAPYAGTLTIDSLSTISAAQLASLAQGSAAIAYRYALKELNPFTVLGNNDLYTQHDTGGKLDLYDSATETGQLTAEYLTDRAEMLSWKIARNKEDIKGIIRRTDGGESKDFVDFAVYSQTGKVTKDVLLVRGGTSLGKLGIQRQVAFGSSSADGLNGSGFADQLYGGEGKDALVAQGGADYLEGGRGDDLLNGGFGNDTYVYLGKEGDDTIVDADGVGKIVYADRNLTGVKTLFNPVIPNLYTDGAFTYRAYIHAQNSILTITKNSDPSGKITVQNFRNGDLGITLSGAVTPPTATSKFGTEHADILDADAPDQNVFGLGGNDRITLATANATGYGGAGNDVIRNGNDDQKLYGEDGNDVLIATAGNDELYGGLGNDALQGGADDDYLEGNDGSDALDGGAGSDTIYGGDGADFILGGGNLVPGIPDDEVVDPDGRAWGVTLVNSQMVLTNMAGASNIEGDAADFIDGGAGNDWIAAGDGNDYVDGGANDDVLVGQGQSDTLLGGTGNDILFGDGTQGSVTFADGQQMYTLPAEHGADYLDGGDGDDNLTGDGGDDTLIGGAGNDILNGDDGRLDEQYHGADYLDGGDGNDRLFGYGKDDVLLGGAGDDRLDGDSSTVASSLHGNDYLDGEDGNDILLGDGGHDTLFGGAGDDQLFGDTDDTPVAFQGDDYLDGEEGNDYLRGYGGNDQLFGEEGNDQLLGEVGDDYLDGGAGDDLLDAGDGNDTLIGGAGADRLIGGAGDDTYIVDMHDIVNDTEGNNRIIFGADVKPDELQITPVNFNGVSALGLSAGGAASGALVTSGLILTGTPQTQNFQFQFADGTVLSQAALYSNRYVEDKLLTAGNSGEVLNGGAGDDTLIGGTGGDTLYGRDGNDNLDGGAGDDTLVGGRGNDVLRGGNGSDTYVFVRGSGQDTIVDVGDLLPGIDTLQLADVLQSDVTLERTANGDLQIRVNGSNDRIAVRGHYSSPDNRIEQIVFADGTGIGVTDLQALQVAPITGTSQGEAIIGTYYNDTLLGLAGNDTLDGGAGNDRLEGGDGQDSYLMRYGMGSDIAIDASPEGSVVRLQPGLELSGLAATRQGEDLLLQIGGTMDALRVQGYYAVPQTWSIEDAAGRAGTPHDLLDATARATQYRLDPIWNNFLAQTKSSIIAGYVNVGYDLTADGTLHRESRGAGFLSYDPSWPDSLGTVGATYTIATTVTNNTLHYFPGAPGITGSYQTITNNEYWNSLGYARVFDTTITIDKVATISDDPIIKSRIGSYDWQGFSAHTDSESDGGATWVKVDWGDSRSRVSPKVGSRVSSISYTSDLFGVDANVIGAQLTNGTVSSITTDVTGQVTGVFSYPGTYRTAGPFPEAVPAARVDHHRSELVEEIKAGAANNIIYAGPRTLSDGGDGNDTIYGGGVAYGGAGDDTIIGSGIQIGGAGDDTLIDGDVMIGGAGNDRMFGVGNATFAIDPGDAGFDLIGAAGNASNYVLDDFYRSRGIPVWSERYSYANTYSYSATLGRVTITQYADEQEIGSVTQGWGLTLDEALAQGRVKYIAPLPIVAVAAKTYVEPAPYYAQNNIPVVNFSANDFQALAPYYANGVIPKDRVVFGEGIAASDLRFSWGRVTVAMSGRDTDPVSPYTALNVAWGDNQGIQVLIPHSDDPLGTGVEEFELADGTKLSMADMIALAPPPPTFDPQLVHEFSFQPGIGLQTLDAGVATVRFAAGIQPGDVTVTRAGLDLLLTYNNGADALRVADWYANPGSIPTLAATFDGGTTWDAATLTAQGLVMHGTTGDDTLTGLSSYSNILIGGAGNDTLIGGAGNDTYVFGLGDGVDRITDPGGNDALQFGAGITSDSLSLGIGSLLIRVGTGGDALHLEAFDPNDVYAPRDIETFRFSDGTTLTYRQLINRGFDLQGSDGNDTISGTNGVDRIHGAGGDDVLLSGAGNDDLFGDAGNDTYIFQRGDGLDTIHDVATSAAGNLIVFGEGVTRNALTFEHEGNTLTIRYDAAGDAIRLPDFNAHNVNGTVVTATLKFVDGSTASLAQLANRAPILTNSLANQDAIEYTPFSVQIPVNAFYDADVGDTLTYCATLADGRSALPGWLAFNADTRTFSGTPTWSNVGTLSVKVTATDSSNLNAFGTFDLTVAKIPGQTLVGTAGNDVLTGGGGDDTLDGRGGSDRLLGNGGDDTFRYFADAKWATAFVAHNEGSPGNPGTGKDAAIAGKNRSYDVFQGGPGMDVLLGTNSDDALFLDDRYSPFPSGREPRLSGIERIEGGNGSDVIDLTSVDYGYGDVTLDGGEGNDVLRASGGNDLLLGGPGNDDLFGGAGQDSLDGGAGADTMAGGAGNDIYIVDNAADTATEAANAGTDTVLSAVTYTLSANVENLTLTGNSATNGTGNTLNNVITGNAAGNTLDGGAGSDTMAGGAGNDTYVVDNAADSVVENANEGYDTINASVTRTIAANVEKLALTGTTAINGTGSAGDDYLVGNNSNNTLTGGAGNDLLNGGSGVDVLSGDAGNDVLEGMDGNDTLSDTGGNNLFNGGAGADTMAGNSGSEFFIGGAGNDSITPGTGKDVITFNRGDGQDTINASTGADNTLSLGGGIRYADMTFSKNTNNLVLNLGGSAEKITLANWYASSPINKSVLNLQVIAEAMTDFDASSFNLLLNKKVQKFDFPGLVTAFDAAGNPNNWALTNQLLNKHLDRSDIEALGGNLAYQYGRNGTLAGIGFDSAVSILSNAAFGAAAQALQPLQDLQHGIKRLS